MYVPFQDFSTNDGLNRMSSSTGRVFVVRSYTQCGTIRYEMQTWEEPEARSGNKMRSLLSDDSSRF